MVKLLSKLMMTGFLACLYGCASSSTSETSTDTQVKSEKTVKGREGAKTQGHKTMGNESEPSNLEADLGMLFDAVSRSAIPRETDLLSLFGQSGTDVKRQDRHISRHYGLTDFDVTALYVVPDPDRPGHPSVSGKMGALFVSDWSICVSQKRFEGLLKEQGWQRKMPQPVTLSGDVKSAYFPEKEFFKDFRRQRLVFETENREGIDCVTSALFLWHMTEGGYKKLMRTNR